jgi:hypothetical protein
MAIAGSEGGGRPSILAMVLAPAAAFGPIRSRNPNWTDGHFADSKFGHLEKGKLNSTAEVLEVFHEPLEAIICLRRYIARLIQ